MILNINKQSLYERNYKYGKHWIKVFKRDNNKCMLCTSTDNLTIDHILPVKKGGKSTLNNMRVLCKNCNTKTANRELKPELEKDRVYSRKWRLDHPGYFQTKRLEFNRRNPGYYTQYSKEFMDLYLQAKI